MENDATTPTAQAHRLEQLYTALEAEFTQPGMMERLRQHASEEDWSAMQALGHIVEIIPYWMHDCQRIIAADTPPTFGRENDAPERLEGVEQGARKKTDELLSQLKGEISSAAAGILAMSDADREKKGIHIHKGETTVAEVLEIFMVAHAEEHLAQIRKALYV